MSTLDAVTADLNNVQQAAQLWTPQAITTGTANTFYLTGTAPAVPTTEEKPRKKLSPLEWLDEQISDVVGLAVP